MTLKNFTDKIVSANAQAYLVGGAVRDKMIGIEPHDHDYVVCGIDELTFVKLFDNPKKTGKQFPVFRLEIDGEEVEVALARKEIKTSAGHNGFEMIFNKDITIEEDLIRRDVTMNSMAISLIDNTLIDPFNGKTDIENKIIRATSKHFLEDPLRILRVARQAAKYNFTVSDDTYELMKYGKNELYTLPYSRVWGEFEKALLTDNPVIFFEVLRKADVLDIVFPEIAKLIGKTQPVQYHPEGDAYVHTMNVLTKVASFDNSLESRFCAVFHDIGKGITPESELPHHYYHDKNGEEIINNWESERFPAKLKKAAAIVARLHMKINVTKKPGKILKMLISLRKNCNLKTMRSVLMADKNISLNFLNDDFVNKVFDKINIPNDLLTENNGEKIAYYVSQERIRRINKLRKGLNYDE